MKKLGRNEWIAVGLAILTIVILLSLSGIISWPGQSEEPLIIPGQEVGTTTGSNATSSKHYMNNGVDITVTREGNGEPIKPGQVAVVNYRGTLADGTVFDESYKRGQPFAFIYGAHQVIPGWELGLEDMKTGEARTLVIPGQLAYGAQGVTDPQTGAVVIPPNATLTFDVELVDIQELADQQ